jgi:hypothetical protein
MTCATSRMVAHVKFNAVAKTLCKVHTRHVRTSKYIRSHSKAVRIVCYLLTLVAALFLAATDLFALVDSSGNADPGIVFAPVIFTTADGSTVSQTTSFTLPALLYAPFTIFVENNGVTSGNIELNGTPLFAPDSFNAQSLTARVPLNADNTLRVELSGNAGASLTVMVLGYTYRNAGDSADLPIASESTTSEDIVEVDWRSKGAVTPVKNQGQCGSDWAFSATGALEGWNQIATGKLVSLSEQQLVDCAASEGAQGCNGGHPAQGLKYAEKHGTCSEQSYPYTARDGLCKKTCTPVVKPTKTVPLSGEHVLETRVKEAGPVSVRLNGDWMGRYHGGIFSGPCGLSLNHSALIVGFGTEGSTPYWLVKNSWGTSWGENGYFRIIRGKNECGITHDATAPQ